MPLPALGQTLAQSPEQKPVQTPGQTPGQTLLFVDDHEVLYRSGTRKVVHPLRKFAGNPVLTPDNPERPWEKSLGYVSVYRDPAGGKLQMWYQAYSGKGAEDKRFKSVVAYAESADGLNWTKPAWKLFPYHTRGYRVDETNIVLLGAAGGYGDRYSNSVVVNPDETDPAKKYKLAYYDWNGGEGEAGGAGLSVAFSPDGIQWTKHAGGVVQKTGFGAKGLQPPFADEGAYAHLVGTDGRQWRQWRYPQTLSDAVDVFWDARLRRYVIYGKMWIGGPDGGLAWKHGLGRSESEDFVHWSVPQLVAYPDEHDPPNLEFHTSPVFQYQGLYFSLNQLYTRENGTVDNELMTSRDGIRWDRTFARVPLIARGGGQAFDAGFVLTNNNPIEMGDELWFYYAGIRGLPRFATPAEAGASPRSRQFGSGIGLAMLRKDRFVGLVPDPQASVRNPKPRDREGGAPPPANRIAQVTLRARDLSGVGSISVNADASAGSLRVELLCEEGFRVRGFTRDDAWPLTADGLAQPVRWKEKTLADLPPGKYHLRLHLDGAELFAVSLHPAQATSAGSQSPQE